ncbi:pleckstrin homology domain-containing family S member 1-like [Pseudorasbora parva]|uniref:pleckstrin homology domain-containing family S member 1-like n=1 Tax=Pseudorasbora parva TaxID=51549 RepID=UPI00351EE0A0
MIKSKKNKTETAKFYKEPATVEEVYVGYLYKSPGQSAFLKSSKSWKRRFFVLSKMGEGTYHLTYYINEEKRDKPVGMIDISKVSLMFTDLETHPMWDWIQKHFDCSPTSVLFLRVEDDTQKHSRDYFLIGKNSDDVNGWHDALKTSKMQHTDGTPEDNRYRSISAPEKSSEPKVEDQSDERWSAPPLMLSSRPTPNHYDYPSKYSESSVLAERKISFKEHKDEKDGKQGEFQEDSSEYMRMASVQMALEDVQQEANAPCIQTNTSINGHESSVCNGAVNQDNYVEYKRMSTERRHSQSHLCSFNGNCASTELDEAPLNNKRETHRHVVKEICISQNSLKSLILTQEEGKPCVSKCRQIQDSRLFHKGDQILAFNDLLVDTVEDIHKYIRRLSKNEVKLTIRRIPGSQPLPSEPCILNC